MDASEPELAQLHAAVLTGDARLAVRVVQAALAAGADPEGLVTGSMIPAMTEVGRRFEEGEYFVAPDRFIASAQEAGADVIALSALLTTTMLGMRRVIELLERDGLRSRFKVIIGGAPVTRQFAQSIGADGYSDTASGAVALARQLVAKS